MQGGKKWKKSELETQEMMLMSLQGDLMPIGQVCMEYKCGLCRQLEDG